MESRLTSQSDSSSPTAGSAAGAHGRTASQAAGRRLRSILRLNAATSLLGGLVAAVASTRLDRLLGTDAVTVVRVVGIGLVVFALGVLAVAGSSIRRLVAIAPWIVVADVAWVVGSVVTITLGWYTTRGAVLVGVVAATVAMFAVEQTVYLLRAVRAES